VLNLRLGNCACIISRKYSLIAMSILITVYILVKFTVPSSVSDNIIKLPQEGKKFKLMKKILLRKRGQITSKFVAKRST